MSKVRITIETLDHQPRAVDTDAFILATVRYNPDGAIRHECITYGQLPSLMLCSLDGVVSTLPDIISQLRKMPSNALALSIIISLERIYETSRELLKDLIQEDA